MDINGIAKEVFTIEAEEILNLSNNLTDDFKGAVEAILNSRGKLIVSGMGKSGIIGKKISATMSSTGTPSFFLHPAEAYHGDLGMVERSDIVLLISNSGESDEVLRVIPFFKSNGNIIIGMSGNPDSTLAKNSNFHLNIGVKKEACPLQLAPTSSTTATLVMGDALAIALMRLRGFRDRDFAKFHPGGSLGRRLLTKVKDVMHKSNLPICSKDTNIKDIVQIVSQGKLGLVVIVEDKKIIGIITDGDIRRAMESREEEFFSIRAEDIMTQNPKMIRADTKLTDAQKLMEQFKVNSLLVSNPKEELIGIVQIYDLGI
jgi:arabinose-5-phosphate isomerase